MEKLFWLLLSLVFVVETLGDKKLLPIAVNQIIRDFYFKSSERVNIIIYGVETKYLHRAVNDILKAKLESFPTTLIEVRQEAQAIEINQSAVLLFDTVESYHRFHDLATISNEYPKRFHLLVYVDDTLLFTKSHGGGLLLRDETFLTTTNDGTSLKLVIFATFQQPSCRLWKEIEINVFESATQKWQSEEFFRDTYSNFNGCELIAAAKYNNLYVTDFDFDENGEVIEGHGYAIRFHEEISKYLNYTIHYNPIHKKTLHNVSMGYHFFIGVIRNHFRMKDEIFFFTRPFKTTEQVFIVSQTEAYTQLEKLFLPFELDVWLWLIGTLAIGVIAIFVINFTPEYIRNFVYGRNVTTPTLNFV